MLIAISHNLRSKKAFAPIRDFALMSMNTQIIQLSLIIPASNAHAVLCCVGVCCFAPCFGKKGGEKMMNSEQYREHIERTFNAFCKIVLYHAALGAYKKIRKKQQFEVSLDYLREFDFEPVTTTDECFVKYDMPTTFIVRRKAVIVESELLAAALLRLLEKRRKVLFLRYYLGYSDTKIGRLFGVCRSTIFHRRKRALRLLRKEMEALENEE